MVDADKLEQIHKGQKNNCCQTVLRYFTDKVDVDEVTLLRVGESFGLGLGGMDGQCGALSGAIILCGLVHSDGILDPHGSNPATYKVARQITDEFIKRTGGLICRDLKGIDTGKMLCSCPDCIRIAAEIAEEILFTE